MIRWRAKFDAERDFDVRFVVARQNPRQISKKQNFSSEKFTENKIFGVEKCNVRNRPKRVLAKFRADRNHPRGVNGRSTVRNRCGEKV